MSLVRKIDVICGTAFVFSLPSNCSCNAKKEPERAPDFYLVFNRRNDIFELYIYGLDGTNTAKEPVYAIYPERIRYYEKVFFSVSSCQCGNVRAVL